MTRYFSKVELRIALSYALFGGLWILLFDKLAAILSADTSVLSRIQTYKGWAFVAAGALLIYYLLRYDRRYKQSNEKALDESQNRLRSILDNAPIVLMSTDRNGVFTLSEGAGLERTGLKPGQVVGLSAYDLYRSLPIYLPNEKTIAGEELLDRVFNGETIIAVTELNGAHFENRFAPLLNRDGTVDGLVGVAIDVTQREQSEENLREAEARYRTLVEQIPPIVYLASPEQYIGVTYISPRINTLGFTQQEWVADPELWFRQIHPEDQKKVLDEIEKIKINDTEEIRRDNGAFKLEYRLISRNGDERWFLDEVLNVFDDHGKILFRQGIMLDITERKRTEDDLREINAKLKKVLEVETAGVMFWDLTTGTMTDANDAFLKLMGYSRREVEAGELTWQKLTPPEYVEASLAEVRKFQETGRIGPYEKEYLRKDGTRLWLVFAGSSLGGNTCVEFCVDISDRKRVEKALQENEKKYRDLVETAHDLIWAVDAQGRITFMNQASKRIYGYEPEELMGRSFFDFLSPEERKRQWEDFPRLLANGENLIVGIENEVVDRDGNRHTLVANSVSVHDQHGNPVGIMGTSTDITERKRAEEEVRLSRDRLATLSRRLVETHEKESRAIGRELHDQIGQMLTAMKITLDMIPQLPAELAARKIKQAQETADDLLNRVSRLSLELRPPMLDDLGLIPALQWHVNHYQDQTGIPVEFIHRDIEGRRFKHEIETTAYRIIQEALTNVARHAQATRVKLEVQERSGLMEIRIEDNGQGFDPKSALAKNRGLSGMRERAGLIGGTFQVESEPGKGTKKRIQLPFGEDI